VGGGGGEGEDLGKDMGGWVEVFLGFGSGGDLGGGRREVPLTH
jgi:hypothetical protein